MNLHLPSGSRFVAFAGGRRFARVNGTGPSVVLLMGGGVAGVGAWDALEGKLAAFATVTTYDRAGTGRSDPSAGAPTVADMSHELHEVLAQLPVRAPHVLVGASLGGLIQLLHASEHPDAVRGLVLLDPTRPDDHAEAPQRLDALRAMQARAAAGEFRTEPGRTELARFFGAALGRPVDRAAAAFVLASFEAPAAWAALLHETQRRHESAQQVREALATQGVPDVPAVVISAGVWPHGPGAAAAVATLHAAHRRIAAFFPRGRHVVASEATHWISLDAPDLVVDAVRSVL